MRTRVARIWIRLLAFAFLFPATCGTPISRGAPADPKSDDAWIELTSGAGLDAWQKPTASWKAVSEVRLSDQNPRVFAVENVVYNGPIGRTLNLVSKDAFADVDLELWFMLPKGSNSGVKLMGLYEVQLIDSYGVKTPKASDCGGIYPRAELLPTYHYLDKGHPPKENACLEPGVWQSLALTFHAPRFDKAGKKIGNCAFRPRRAQWKAHPRERRARDADRPCMARQRVCHWPASPSGGSWTRGVSGCEDPSPGPQRINVGSGVRRSLSRT